MPDIQALLSERLAAAFEAVAGAPVDPLVQRSAHADFQSNAALAVAKAMHRPPRVVAAAVLAAADLGGLATGEVSGPGFVNLTVDDAALWRSIAAADSRCGVPVTRPGERIVIDYSSPNVAKEMHVGHLRSTVIGDALVRILRFLGADVTRQNHIGDWGTQFGMLIAYLREHPALGEAPDTGMRRLTRLYQAAHAKFGADPDFVERSRRAVVALQGGDPAARAAWCRMVDESMAYFTEVYDLLDVELVPADAVGESFYNAALPGIADDLAASGIAVDSEGALCVFFDGVRGPDGSPVPLIVCKSDGGYGYAATDFAAIRHRVDTLHADRIYYVVDARQALHFRMVFETARRADWLPADVITEHVPFGTVLGADGKPLKTRSGETIRLIELLASAVHRAAGVIAEKDPSLHAEALAARAREVGVGAVKYADLSTGRTRDYVFDLDRMVSLSGNTGVYLQYAHARVCAILRRAAEGHAAAAESAAGASAPGGSAPGDSSAAESAVGEGAACASAGCGVDVDVRMVDAERRLALALDGFGAAVAATGETLEPHRLCAYLFDLAQTLTAFYDACPVLSAPEPAVRSNRLALCTRTADTLALGMSLLGIAAPDRL